MKKSLILCVALVVLLLAGCKEKVADETIPGVEDSIFDQAGEVEIDRPEDTKAETEQNATQSTKPTSPKPTIPDGPKNPGDVSEPSMPDEPELPTKPATQPTTPEATEPTEPEATEPTQESLPTEDYTKLDYLGFHALKGAQQQAVMESFESIDAFFAWYNKLKDEYEKANPPIEVDGPIDLDKVLGGKQ
jgi:cytoskeletal protein RodZ